MTDPERLLMSARTGGVDEFEVQLLDSLRDVSAPPEAKARGWEAVSHLVGAAAASTAYSAGYVAGSTTATAYAMNAIYPVLPAGCTSPNVGGTTYFFCGNTWFQPSYGANGVYYRVVPTP